MSLALKKMLWFFNGMGCVVRTGCRKKILLVMFCASVLLSAPVQANEKDSKKSSAPAFEFENEQLRVWLRPRTTTQMAAFFEARGFPEQMVEKLSGYCFFTVVVKNKMSDNLVMDLSQWKFFGSHQPVTRLPRSVWPPLWKKLNIPLAAQSTFRWTLLPENLNFYAHENEGGNIILEKTDERFDIRAPFGKGTEKDKLSILALIKNVQCADASEERR